jgi:hypothetical protein
LLITLFSSSLSGILIFHIFSSFLLISLALKLLCYSFNRFNVKVQFCNHFLLIFDLRPLRDLLFFKGTLLLLLSIDFLNGFLTSFPYCFFLCSILIRVKFSKMRGHIIVNSRGADLSRSVLVFPNNRNVLLAFLILEQALFRGCL